MENSMILLGALDLQKAMHNAQVTQLVAKERLLSMPWITSELPSDASNVLGKDECQQDSWRAALLPGDAFGSMLPKTSSLCMFTPVQRDPMDSCGREQKHFWATSLDCLVFFWGKQTQYLSWKEVSYIRTDTSKSLVFKSISIPST